MSVQDSMPVLHFLTEQMHKMQKRDALSALRKKAWQRFLLRGLPQRKEEAFGSIPLREYYARMAKASYKNVEQPRVTEQEKQIIKGRVLPECAHAHLVFIDGAFSLQLSDVTALAPQILLRSLSDAMRSHGQFLQAYLLKSLQEETDPFALLNLSLHEEGIFLYVPPHLNSDQPIQCLCVQTERASAFSAARAHVVIAQHSHLHWINSSVTLTENEPDAHCATPLTDFFLEEGAQCSVISHISSVEDYWWFDTLRAHLKRDAAIKMVSLLKGAKAIRQNIHVRCAGENSQADLKGLWVLQEALQAHVHVLIDHAAAHTRSMQLFKGVLRDASVSSFTGKILVRQAAQKTQAYQLNNNLVLGKAALAHSKPNLEIFADDVKASHGATIAMPDASQLFYFKSRGIEETRAQEMLVNGFCKEIIDYIPYEKVYEYI